MYLPHEDVFVTLLSNCDRESLEDVTAKLALLAIGKSSADNQVPIIKVDEKILEIYVGEYHVSPPFSFVITRNGTKLFLKATNQEMVEISAIAENKFIMAVNGAQLEFVKGSDGKITKAVLTQGIRQTDAMKVK